MKRIGILFVAVFLSFFISASAQEVPLSLDEAIAIALRDNRDILLKTEDLRKAKSKLAEAEAGLFPILNISASLTDTRGLYSKELSQSTTQTTLKQYLYKGGETINTIKQNKDNLEVTQSLLDKTKLELILNVKKGFYTLLLAKELAGLNKGILDNTREHLDLLKARYINGEVSESEVLKIEDSLSSVHNVYEDSLNQAEAAGAFLNNLLYLEKDIKIVPEAEFDYAERQIAFDEAFLEAMKRRPEIKQYEAQVRADKRGIEIAKADNRPSVYASWDYYSRSHTSGATSRNWNDHNIIGLTFSWPIFDGWATKAKVEQAMVSLKETQLLQEKAVKDIVLELKEAYLDLKSAVSRTQSLKSQLGLYRNTLLVAQEKYNYGIISLLDLHDADLSYRISLFNQKEAIYDYILAKARFDKASGGSI